MARNNFVVVGMPRTGTTLLVDLLNSHEEIFCDNELFNPHMISRYNAPGEGSDAVRYRNVKPIRFWDEFYNSQFSKGYEAIGFNYMLGHDYEVLDRILKGFDLKIVYVFRENRLAQYASFKKAVKDQEWGVRDTGYNAEKAWKNGKIVFSLGDFEEWMQTVNCLSYMFEELSRFYSNNIFPAEYKKIASGELNQDICAYLGVEVKALKGGLVKQGTRNILDRFSNPDEVKEYMGVIGKKHWCGIEV